MSRNIRKMLFLAVFCAAGIISVIPGFLFKARNSNIHSVKSALLNPKYISEVNEISVSFPENAIVTNADTFMGKDTFSFTKETNLQGYSVWLCRSDSGLTFPANNTIINQLIERASKTVSMAEISDSYSSWSALGLSDDTAVNIIFSASGSDGSVRQFSSLFFGGENADGTMIYVRTDRKSTSWRINNTFSSYLTDSIASWADQRLLPAGYDTETDSTRTCISVKTADISRKMYNDVQNSAQFDDNIHTLLSLRSSEIISSDQITLFFETEPGLIMTVTLEGTDSSSVPYGFNVWQAEYDGEPYYLAQNFGIISSDESEYFLAISEWTLQKILDAVNF